MVLNGTTLLSELQHLAAWRIGADQKTISRSLLFPGFPQAFAFMTEVALHAERMDHHPDWQNVYNRVSITLSTHDAGGVTDKDLALAAVIDRIADRHQAKAGAQAGAES